MRFGGRRSSDNVEFREGGSGGFGGGGGGGGGAMLLGLVFSRFGLGGVVVLLVLMFLFGGLGSSSAAAASRPWGRNERANSARTCQSRARHHASPARRSPRPRIMGGAARRRVAMSPPKMVIFDRADRSGCGTADARDGPVLLPRRPCASISTPPSSRARRALRRARRFRPGLCDRARGRPSCPDPERHLGPDPRGHRRRSARARRMRCRSGWNCRPIASPASGPRASGARWSRATSRRGCAPPPRSATTRCSAPTGQVVARKASPTAAPPSARRR